MTKKRRASDETDLEQLIDDITTNANGDDEQLWAFRQALEDGVAMPCEATVIGEPVQVLKFDYDGNMRRGLTATCRLAEGPKHVVAATEVVIRPSTQCERYLAAYRKWMGLAAVPPAVAARFEGSALSRSPRSAG